MVLPPKSEFVNALHTALREELAAVERMAAMARDEATSSETKAEGKYDTRATEASYLARGQAERIAELRRLNAWYELSDRGVPVGEPVVQLGALVVVESETSEVLFVAPVGGTRAEVAGILVRAVSLSSPLGRAIRDLEEGDGVEVVTPRGVLDIEVVSIG